MEKVYEIFVEELRGELLKKTGYGEKQIYYKKKDEYPPTSGDRLILKQFDGEGTAEICALYIRELYEYYKNGSSLSEIVTEVMKRVRRLFQSEILKKARDISNYEKIKEELFIRLLNRERYAEELENVVYREFGDIALVLYVRMCELDSCITSMKVKEYMIEEWEEDINEVFDKALLNTYFISPPRIYQWEKMIAHPYYEGDNFMNLLSEYPIKTDILGNCLSTTKRTNGAVAIFLPGVAERIANLMNDSFYIVFTSIHEAMIHSVHSADPKDLSKVLADTVRETTPSEDFLTLRIYQYDKETGQFLMVA